MKVLIKNILPNPFRDIKRYKFNQDVLDELRDSINSTGFWDNLLCRRTGNGKVEMAYGHHRLQALKGIRGAPKEIDMVIKKLSDVDMVRIMYRENNELYGRRAETTVEAVQTVIQGYADGRWTLVKPARDTAKATIRYAPRYVTGERSDNLSDRPYTALTVAEFLGVDGRGTEVNKIKFALQALQAIEEKTIARSDIKGQTPQQASETVRAARRVERAVAGKVGAKAGKKAGRAAAKKIAKGFRSQQRGIKDARKEVSKAIKRAVPKDKGWIDDSAKDVGRALQSLLTPKTDLGEKITALVKEASHLNDTRWNSLVVGLQRVGERADKYLEQLQSKVERKQLR